MTHTETIMQAVATIVKQEAKDIFTREDIRERIGVSRDEWMSSYTAIFQGMRADQPGGALNVGAEFKNVFRQVEHGKHTLTDYGRQLIQQLIAKLESVGSRTIGPHTFTAIIGGIFKFPDGTEIPVNILNKSNIFIVF